MAQPFFDAGDFAGSDTAGRNCIHGGPLFSVEAKAFVGIMNSCIKKHFSNADRALATLSAFGLSMGVASVTIVTIGVHLAR